MLDLNSDDLSFKDEGQVEAYARFFLKVKEEEIRGEYESDEEWANFVIKRERAIKYQLDLLQNLNFEQANASPLRETRYFKIVKNRHITTAISSDGANKKASRFNYKHAPLLRNRVIYFGQDKLACETELFHLEAQIENLRQLFDAHEKHSDDIVPGSYTFLEYETNVPNILILTTRSCWKALGITESVLKNEWFEINDIYGIPSASQILGTIARLRGYNGILYASVRNQAKHNLVLFEENTGKVVFPEKDRLPYTPSPDFFQSNT